MQTPMQSYTYAAKVALQTAVAEPVAAAAAAACSVGRRVGG
jgi:hypothetical protein